MTQNKNMITKQEKQRIDATGLRHKFIAEKIGCKQNEFSHFYSGRRKLAKYNELLTFLQNYEANNKQNA